LGIDDDDADSLLGMDVQALDINGAWVFTPRQHSDDRGAFLEWYREEVFAGAVGHPLTLAQSNHSLSRRGVLRGLHFADVPPGQAKYVYCPRGAVLDVAVDLRVGSPTFGRSCAVRLDDTDRRAIYLAEGLGHAFLALEDDSSVTYLCSTSYNPQREHTVHPQDPELALPWPGDVEPLLSPRDAAAPSLAEARSDGLLASYDDCRAYYSQLRDEAQRDGARRTGGQ